MKKIAVSMLIVILIQFDVNAFENYEDYEKILSDTCSCDSLLSFQVSLNGDKKPRSIKRYTDNHLTSYTEFGNSDRHLYTYVYNSENQLVSSWTSYISSNYKYSGSAIYYNYDGSKLISISSDTSIDGSISVRAFTYDGIGNVIREHEKRNEKFFIEISHEWEINNAGYTKRTFRKYPNGDIVLTNTLIVDTSNHTRIRRHDSNCPSIELHEITYFNNGLPVKKYLFSCSDDWNEEKPVFYVKTITYTYNGTRLIEEVHQESQYSAIRKRNGQESWTIEYEYYN